MGKVFKAITGGLLGGAPKVQAPAPVNYRQPVAEVADEEKGVKAARVALYATEGGATGQELSPDQVSRRRTLLGN